MATPYFYRGLRKIASDNEIAFIVDEAQTGLGTTGKLWGHNHWNLKEKPDIVTFGGKVGFSGFYSNESYKLNEHGVSFEGELDL